MGMKKDFIRRTTPDKELMLALDEMLGNTSSDSTKRSSKRLTKQFAPFIKLGSLILAFILFMIFAFIIFRDTPTEPKRTTPPTIEQKSSQEIPDVFKKL